jgi:S1-C subfamily serine protease
MKRLLLSILTVGMLGVGAYSFIQPSQPQTVSAQEVTGIDENAAFLQDEENTISIVDTYGPSVVAINVTIEGQTVDPFAEFRDQLPPGFQLPDQGDQPIQGAGSGFVVDERGHIVTNFHVVAEALNENSNELVDGAEVTVTFSGSDDEIPVKVLGVNALYDFAMLQLENASDLPETAKPIPLGNSDELKVGQKVVAIGNPFGLESTVTTGIVSAVNRSYVPSIGGIQVPMVQTDAAINPGNSGGPLLNSKGELIGINTAIIPSVGISGDRGNLGIGFAMPSNTLKDNLAGLRDGTFVGDLLSRPRIGIQGSSVESEFTFTREQIEEFNLPKEGVALFGVAPDGPGAKAGLSVALDSVTQKPVPEATDIILEIDGKPVSTLQGLQQVVLAKKAGDVVTLKVWRNGEERNVEVTLEVVEQN